MSLRDKLKSIPKHPGVYFFKDKNSDIIYIGKAKNLKNFPKKLKKGRKRFKKPLLPGVTSDSN